MLCPHPKGSQRMMVSAASLNADASSNSVNCCKDVTAWLAFDSGAGHNTQQQAHPMNLSIPNMQCQCRTQS